MRFRLRIDGKDYGIVEANEAGEISISSPVPSKLQKSVSQATHKFVEWIKLDPNNVGGMTKGTWEQHGIKLDLIKK